MATRSEQYRAGEQRHGKPKRKQRSGSKPGVAPKNRSRAKDSAGKKATHAFEATEKGKRPSRKSTRGGANRAKPDATFNIVEEMRKGSPASRFRQERARGQRPRGKSSGR